MQTHEKWMVAVIAAAAAAVLTLPHWLPADAFRAAKREVPVEAREPRPPPSPEPMPPHDPSTFARLVTTEHYAIASNATQTQTQQAAEGLESLHAAWRAQFADRLEGKPVHARLQVALYRDRADFKAHNAARAWAQGYYRTPVAHAWFDARASNPTHWLLHEATHQLDAEVAGFARTPWVEEGLATYFAASRVVDGELRPGEIDFDAYPLRWLGLIAPSGDLQRDLAARRLVPLQELHDSDGPEHFSDVYGYYLGYWSLTHYLLHGDDGRHAGAFRAMVADGGSFEQFEQRVGRVDGVQAAWYAYVMQQAAARREHAERAAGAH
jgi:hypothetical protein